MGNVEWNEGMSVGVEAIDSDHKALLLVINEVNESLGSDDADILIKEIFEKLEKYIKQHFQREERLLEQCDYSELDDHKKQHREFVEKIPELKKRLLNSDSVEIAQEVQLFLLNWLMMHIIIDDMSYAQTLHDHGLATTSQTATPLLEKAFFWIGKRVVLDKRVFISTLLPMIGLVILSATILWYSFQQYSSTRNLVGLTDVIRNINTLSHSLQAERGLSTGYISSNYQHFLSQLKARRDTTDIALQAYQKTVIELSPELSNEDMRSHFSNSDQWISELIKQRNTVDNRAHIVEEMQDYYTDFISSLISVYDAMALLEIEVKLIHNIATISAMTQLKEAAGLERAYGTQILEKGVPVPADYQKFSQLIGEQVGLLRFFKHVATSQRKMEWDLFSNSNKQMAVSRFEAEIIEATTKSDRSGLDSKIWFEVISNKIDHLKLLIDGLVKDIDTTANGKIDNLQGLYWKITTVLMFIVLITLLISWLLSKSIIFPIRRITQAMTHLSNGHRDVRFTNHFADDEIGEMVNAYEYSRRKLLQSDIFSAISRKRQSITLEQKEREKSQYIQLASIDPLTGAINRRKFNELAELELIRVRRYRHGLSVMMLDNDHFKAVNDTYGHPTGDSVLKEFYQACKKSVRNNDVVARIGGEEFVILMPETQLHQAHILAERICKTVENLTVIIDGATIKFTVSIGVVAWNENIRVIDALIEKSDKALYKAKDRGRNQVVSE